MIKSALKICHRGYFFSKAEGFLALWANRGYFFRRKKPCITARRADGWLKIPRRGYFSSGPEGAVRKAGRAPAARRAPAALGR